MEKNDIQEIVLRWWNECCEMGITKAEAATLFGTLILNYLRTASSLPHAIITLEVINKHIVEALTANGVFPPDNIETRLH